MKQRSLSLLWTAILAFAFLSACDGVTKGPTSTAQVEPPVAAKPTDVPRALTETALPQSARPAAPTPMPQLPSTDWPMFRFSLDRAGYNPHETDVKPPLSMKWQYKTAGKI